jgi:hypothetical protein
MTEHELAVPVLARFPDVNDVVCVAPVREAKGGGLLASSRRLFGQATSIKLLAGTALFLLVGAVLPFCIGNKPPADLSPPQELVAVKPKASNAGPQASAVPDEAAALIASRPAVRVVPAKEPSVAPAPLSRELDNRLPARTVADTVQASPWHPPAVGGEPLAPDVNRPATVRPAEYEEADARARLMPGSDRENRR